MNKILTRTIIILTVYSIAMGFLEAAVVVYLRELFYPEGFEFPLKSMSLLVIKTELLREAATIIMLYSIGWLAAGTRSQRFAYFILCFAVWDIFYYVFLKLLLNWPSSIIEWDILFLIPVPWIGPVLAPVLVSLSLILWALMIEYYSASGIAVIKKFQWWLFVTGCMVVIISFTLDYFIALFQGADLLKFGAVHQPGHFNWLIFICGQLLMLTAILFQNNFILHWFSIKSINLSANR